MDDADQLCLLPAVWHGDGARHGEFLVDKQEEVRGRNERGKSHPGAVMGLQRMGLFPLFLGYKSPYILQDHILTHILCFSPKILFAEELFIHLQPWHSATQAGSVLCVIAGLVRAFALQLCVTVMENAHFVHCCSA